MDGDGHLCRLVLVEVVRRRPAVALPQQRHNRSLPAADRNQVDNNGFSQRFVTLILVSVH